MSFSPYDPTGVGSSRKGMRPVLVLLLIAATITGLGLLAWNFQRFERAPVSGTTPSAVAAAQATSTAWSRSGLNGPEPPSPVTTTTAAPTAQTQLPSATTTPVVALSLSEQALRTLDAAKVPVRDLYSITARLKKIQGEVPRTTDKPAGNYASGRKDVFNISNITEQRYYTITATIAEVSEHAYWYVENGIQVSQDAVRKVAATFESSIYPTNRRMFGSEWTPGVDNDPRITVLFADITGAGGYYSSADEYTRAVNRFSNEREIIYIGTDGAGGIVGVEGVLAHEFQHMIHWHEHPNHDVWLNEGASVLAADLNGFNVGGVDARFMTDTDVQLTTWRPVPSESISNYGASFLFLDYLRAHYGGDKIIGSTVAAEGQGPDAIDNALTAVGRTERFTDVFKNWTIANLVDGLPGSAENGLDYPDREVQVSPQDQIDTYPKEYSGQVSQFGADYIQLEPPAEGSNLRVKFSGQADTPIISTTAHSGKHIWWSNRGDVADARMTRRFDLRSEKAATLSFSIWYDVEEDLDYGYVEASTDGGATWDTL
ncbi:MAG TPA: hypothetical protein VM409_04705, partial [Chloroflexia bacterium]|nr:hypothetical protein [Chloroflexia bacterium]